MEVDTIINEESPLINFDEAELEQELVTLNDTLEFPTIPVHDIELNNDNQTTATLDEAPLYVS